MELKDCSMELKDCTLYNTPKFNFNNQRVKAKVLKVYDGDSITAAWEVHGKVYKFNIRMDGYDSPELRTSSVAEKKYALKSRDYLRQLILNKIVEIECKDYDKYGRVIGVVYNSDGNNVNEMMLQNGWCMSYDGGTKSTWDELLFLWEHEEEMSLL